MGMNNAKINENLLESQKTQRTKNRAHTVDSDLTFVFDFSIVVFNHTFVFAVHFGGHIGHQQFICFTIVRLLVFGALFTDNFTVNEPLDARPIFV